jgi:hypothetical protein
MRWSRVILPAIGVCAIGCAWVLSGRVVSGVQEQFSVRPAAPSEAAVPERASDTIVGVPGATAPLPPILRGFARRLVACALLAALGAGLIVFGLWRDRSGVALEKPVVVGAEAKPSGPED